MPEIRAPLLAHTGREGRVGFVAVEQGFAGRTMGALAVTYDEHYRAPFGPLIGPVTFVNPIHLTPCRRGERSHRGHHRRADPG